MFSGKFILHKSTILVVITDCYIFEKIPTYKYT